MVLAGGRISNSANKKIPALFLYLLVKTTQAVIECHKKCYSIVLSLPIIMSDPLQSFVFQVDRRHGELCYFIESNLYNYNAALM